MSQKIAFFDLDGTLFRWQLYHELVFELKKMGVFDDKTAESLDLALLQWQSKQKSWHDYEMTLIKVLAENVVGLPTDLFDRAAQNVVENSGDKVYNYTSKLVKKLKNEGYFMLAVTGSFQEVAEPFAKKYGFDDCIGALLPRADGRFTAADSVRAVFGQKAERISEYIADKSFDLTDSVAVGDSAGDTSMLKLAKQPIAFNPSQELLEIAIENGWRVVVERKNVAYTLEKQDGSVVLAKTDTYQPVVS